METVAFITTEPGDDLVVTFAVVAPDAPEEIESLSLIRTPKFEFLVEQHERGVRVFFQRDEDIDAVLKAVKYSEKDQIVIVETAQSRYELDVAKVEPSELADMRAVLKKMNFDQSFRTTGV